MPKTLENKVAWVTGALGLLGREHCRALSQAGAKVVACDLDERAASDFALSLGGEAMGIGADVTDPSSVREGLRRVEAQLGSVSVLVNNAAINDKFEDPALACEQSKFEHYPLEMWRKMLDVNVTGVFVCSQVIGTPMAERGAGSIINIASTYGMVGPDQSIYRDRQGNQRFYKSAGYPATKGAVISFTRFLAAYWGEAGVRVNSLSPGGVENGQDEQFLEAYSRKTPLGRMARPTDFHGAVVFLASDAASYMTGTNLVVDGGWTAW